MLRIFQDDQNKDAQARPGTAALPDLDQVAAPEEQAYGEDDDHVSVTDVPELSNFLANAPGLYRISYELANYN